MDRTEDQAVYEPPVLLDAGTFEERVRGHSAWAEDSLTGDALYP